jgi:beta-glucosidase
MLSRGMITLLLITAMDASLSTPASPDAPRGPAPSPWLDPALNADARAQLAVKAMTMGEKLSLVQGDTVLEGNGTGVNACVGHLPAIKRLGLPELCFGDGPAGVGNGMTKVTEFPAPIVGASTWDVRLMREYGTALGEEHAGKGRNVVLAPTLNILRTPRWGRAAESLGEDPVLTANLGVALIGGIQSNHIIATPKHFVANNQETLRLGDAPGYAAIDVQVGERALREIYYPAFRAAVAEAHAGSVMCSYNRVNGIYACEHPALDRVLRQEWKFDGFVVSDWYFAHRSAVAAALAGLDVSMPGGRSDFGFPEFYGAPLRDAIIDGRIPSSRLDVMAANVLRPMFRLGLVDAPRAGGADADVRTAAHTELAFKIAAEGSVLLKNQHGVLPFDANVHVLAVIGDDAGAHVQTTERYGGFVNDPNLKVRTPLEAITERAGSAVVNYSVGTLGTGALPVVPTAVLAPASKHGSGLTASWYGSENLSGPVVLQTVEPTLDLRQPPAGLPPVWSARWQGTLTPPKSGRYRFSLSGGGDSALYIDGREVVRTSKQGFTSVTHGVVALRGGRPVSIRVDYSMAPTISRPTLQLGWQPPDDLLARAAAAARRADAAIVFAGDNVSEGGDRTELRLPGDQDEMIRAVADANPRTVVVLHTVGPVLMPWLPKVAAVIEAWYPGEEAANAIAATLFGDINPSGKLPMTFPAHEKQGPDAMFGGGGDLGGRTGLNGLRGLNVLRGKVRYSEGLLVGYRYYDSKRLAPLFPFGFGLSYTTFGISQLHVTPSSGEEFYVEGMVSNAGRREGAAVVQLYLGFPRSAGEPPWQLKGFDRIELAAGERRAFRFAIDRPALGVWDGAHHTWTIARGTYRIGVGSSSRDIAQQASLVL